MIATLATNGSAGFEVLDSTEHTYNDTMNADALIDRYGDRIRHVRGLGWLAYDGTRWEKDAEADVIEFAAETMRALGKWAFDLPNSDTRKRLLAHANRSLDMRDLSNMVKRAESDRRIRAKVEDFDRDPMKFNCLNGTLDLATGTLQPPSPTDYIHAPVRGGIRRQRPLNPLGRVRVVGGEGTRGPTRLPPARPGLLLDRQDHGEGVPLLLRSLWG